MNKRGRTVTVANQYLSTVKPMHEQFVQPTKALADVIIAEGGRNVAAVNRHIETI